MDASKTNARPGIGNGGLAIGERLACTGGQLRRGGGILMASLIFGPVGLQPHAKHRHSSDGPSDRDRSLRAARLIVHAPRRDMQARQGAAGLGGAPAVWGRPAFVETSVYRLMQPAAATS